MSQPVTPKFFANQLTLQNMSVRFNQTWNGAAWVIDPSTIQVIGLGIMASNGADTARADIVMTADQLPAAGQAALQDLLQYTLIRTVDDNGVVS